MQINNFKNSNGAVVGIVVTFLLIGLIVTVLSIVQTVYIPRWMEQTESDHLDVVADQFAQLKTSIDIQSFSEQPNTPIATSITLGSKELPFFMSVRAYGSLNIVSDAYNVTIKNNIGSNSYSLGVIKYSSGNAYFLDQSYIYEAGAVITSQSQGNIMAIKPSFSVNYSTGVITFRIIDISGVGGKISGSGYGSIPIQTEFYNSTTTILDHVQKITINTSYTNAWYKFLDNSMKKAGHYSLTPNDGKGVTLIFNNSPTVVLIVIKINAQIGPGWIE